VAVACGGNRQPPLAAHQRQRRLDASFPSAWRGARQIPPSIRRGARQDLAHRLRRAQDQYRASSSGSGGVSRRRALGQRLRRRPRSILCAAAVDRAVDERLARCRDRSGPPDPSLAESPRQSRGPRSRRSGSGSVSRDQCLSNAGLSGQDHHVRAAAGPQANQSTPRSLAAVADAPLSAARIAAASLPTRGDRRHHASPSTATPVIAPCRSTRRARPPSIFANLAPFQR
jgi:hypothetical protein